MKAVIVGGQGKMAKPFQDLLSLLNYQVSSLDSSDWIHARCLLENANLVLFAVPIKKTEAVIKEACNYINSETLLVDITSIKAIPLQTMLNYHSGPVMGLHPMFGPNVLFEQNKVVSNNPPRIVNCGGRSSKQSEDFIQQLSNMGFDIVAMPAEQHDHLTGFIQGLHYFNVFLEGLFLNLYSKNRVIADISGDHSDNILLQAINEIKLMFTDTSKFNLYDGMVFYLEERIQLYKKFLIFCLDYIKLNKTSHADSIIKIQNYFKTGSDLHILKRKILKPKTAFEIFHSLLLFLEALFVTEQHIANELHAISTSNYQNKLLDMCSMVLNQEGEEQVTDMFSNHMVTVFQELLCMVKENLDKDNISSFFKDNYFKIANKLVD